jgi:hypothetical protein
LLEAERRVARILYPVRLVAPALACLFAVGATFAQAQPEVHGWLAAIAVVGALVCVLALIASLIAMFWAEPFRYRYRREFRRELARLRPEERMIVLKDVAGQSAPGAGVVVRPLIDEFWPKGREIAPSAAPEGRNSELAGTAARVVEDNQPG